MTQINDKMTQNKFSSLVGVWQEDKRLKKQRGYP